MARIRQYELDDNITVNDYLLGNDADNPSSVITKRFSIEDLREFYLRGTFDVTDVPQRYIPTVNQTGDDVERSPLEVIHTNFVNDIILTDDGQIGGVNARLIIDQNANATVEFTDYDERYYLPGFVGRTFSFTTSIRPGITYAATVSSYNGFINDGSNIIDEFTITNIVASDGGSPIQPDGPINNLSVNGGVELTVDFESNVTIDGDLSVSENLTVDGTGSIGSDFSVGGDTSLAGDLDVDGNLNVDGTSQFNDEITIGTQAGPNGMPPGNNVDVNLSGTLHIRNDQGGITFGEPEPEVALTTDGTNLIFSGNGNINVQNRTEFQGDFEQRCTGGAQLPALEGFTTDEPRDGSERDITFVAPVEVDICIMDEFTPLENVTIVGTSSEATGTAGIIAEVGLARTLVRISGETGALITTGATFDFSNDTTTNYRATAVDQTTNPGFTGSATVAAGIPGNVSTFEASGDDLQRLEPGAVFSVTDFTRTTPDFIVRTVGPFVPSNVPGEPGTRLIAFTRPPGDATTFFTDDIIQFTNPGTLEYDVTFTRLDGNGDPVDGGLRVPITQPDITTVRWTNPTITDFQLTGVNVAATADAITLRFGDDPDATEFPFVTDHTTFSLNAASRTMDPQTDFSCGRITLRGADGETLVINDNGVTRFNADGTSAPGPTTVAPNVGGGTAALTSIQIGERVFNIPTGGTDIATVLPGLSEMLGGAAVEISELNFFYGIEQGNVARWQANVFQTGTTNFTLAENIAVGDTDGTITNSEIAAFEAAFATNLPAGQRLFFVNRTDAGAIPTTVNDPVSGVSVYEVIGFDNTTGIFIFGILGGGMLTLATDQVFLPSISNEIHPNIVYYDQANNGSLHYGALQTLNSLNTTHIEGNLAQSITGFDFSDTRLEPSTNANFIGPSAGNTHAQYADGELRLDLSGRGSYGGRLLADTAAETFNTYTLGNIADTATTLTVTLPAGNPGDWIEIVNQSIYAFNGVTNELILNSAGNVIEIESGLWRLLPAAGEKINYLPPDEDVVLNDQRASFKLTYGNTDSGWLITGIE